MRMGAISISVVNGDRTNGLSYSVLPAAGRFLGAVLVTLSRGHAEGFPCIQSLGVGGIPGLDRRSRGRRNRRLAARAIPIQIVPSQQGLSRWILAILTPSELLL